MEATDPTDLGMSVFSVGCYQIPIIPNPYGSGYPHPVPVRTRVGHYNHDERIQSVAQDSQQPDTGVKNPESGKILIQYFAPWKSPLSIIPDVSNLAPPQTIPGDSTKFTGSRVSEPNTSRGKWTLLTP